MLKISRYSAYQPMDQADFDLMDSTHERLATVARNKGKSGELSSQFYVTLEKKLRLAFYIGSEEVEEILFDKNIELTENREMKLAELKAEKNMIEISQVEAIQAMDENDLAVREEELIISVLDIVGEIISNKKSLISAATDKKAHKKYI